MKKKITALLCMAAMLAGLTAGAAEEETFIPADTQSAAEEIADIQRAAGSGEDLIYKIGDEDSETGKKVLSEENGAPVQDDFKIESNNNLNISKSGTETVTELREKLENLIEELKNCDPGDVSSEESFTNFNSAIERAEEIVKDSGADGETISNTIEELKAAVRELEYVSGQSILTNNSFSDSDRDKYYPEMTGENPELTLIETNASYSYEDASPLAGLDSGKAMTDGSFAAIQTGNNETAPSVLVFDMGDEYFINGIDVFSQFYYVVSGSTSVIRNIKGFEAEVSSDGVNYKKIASADAKTQPEAGERTDDLKTSAYFAAVSARYVRITVMCDETSSRYNLREIVIKGFKSPFSRDDLYQALIMCAGVDASVHTPQSYSAYKNAYDNAERIYWDEGASGKIIYRAKIELENAYAALVKNAEIKILSGNVTSEFDRKHYAGFSLDTANLSYTYMEGSNPQIVSQDSGFNKLLQGGCDALQSANMTYGTWDNANPAKILFDMGEECYISGADVWEYYQGRLDSPTSSTAATRAGWVRIWVGSDPENLTQVSEIYNPKTDEENMVANCIAQDFEPVKGRYVLVVVEKGTSHQITLNEIVIKGFKTGEKASQPYDFGLFDYKNEAGSRIIKLDGNEKAVVSGSIKSNLDEAKDAVVITAAYKNNDIVDWSVKSVHIGAYGTAEFENEIELGFETGVELYTFVWDSLENGLAMSRQKKFGSL